MKLLPAALIALLATPAFAEGPSLDLVAPIAEYKLYVSDQTEQLVTDTRAFVAAVKGQGQGGKPLLIYAEQQKVSGAN